jgi:hypothetical protein
MTITQQIAMDIIAPPILTSLWWLASRGTAMTIQGGTVSEKTKQRQRRRFWTVLVVIYICMIGTTIYFNTHAQ